MAAPGLPCNWSARSDRSSFPAEALMIVSPSNLLGFYTL
jgi:hypothetical protein